MTKDFQKVFQLACDINKLGGKLYIVGGFVRDFVLGKSISPIVVTENTGDIDCECFDIVPEKLQEYFNSQNLIYDKDSYKSFGIFKLENYNIEIAIPRREIQTGNGHNDFHIELDPYMSVKEAGSRRDFTINALYFDIIDGNVIDNFGVDDFAIQNGKIWLMPVNLEKFKEDALRVFRAMRFISYGFYASQALKDYCSGMSPEGLSSALIWREFSEMFAKGKDFKRALDFLKDIGWLKYFPELEALTKTPQNPKYHPEGDVWIHTSWVCDNFKHYKTGDADTDVIIGLACLCHDLGKPCCTKWHEDRWVSYNHAVEGVAYAEKFLNRIGAPKKVIDEVCLLVKHHMKPYNYARIEETNEIDYKHAVKNLSTKVGGSLKKLLILDCCDSQGRNGLKAFAKFHTMKLWQEAESQGILEDKIKPIILGRHLIQEFGIIPGPELGGLLKLLFDAQVRGDFDNLEAGLAYARINFFQNHDKRHQ